VILWFNRWLARLVGLGGQLAAALVQGILQAFRAPLAKSQKKKDEP
jgi:hypothetical protein